MNDKVISFWNYADLKKSLGDKKRFWKEDCPFCRDIQTGERVYWKWEYWSVLYNSYPYILSGDHFMAIPIRHVTYGHELTSNEWSELSRIQEHLRETFRNVDYFSFTRESLAERSVEHYHMHFIKGDITRRAIIEMLKEQWIDTNE